MMPSLFLSHGSPMLALEDAPTTRFLRQLSTTLPKPRAIVIASAHWETEEPTLGGAEYPETIHDFQGFPRELYALRYAVPGDPVLAEHVRAMLQAVGFRAMTDPSRGLDHGAWNPLMLMYPAAQIPVVALSVQPHRDARWHYLVGQALAGLREEGVLLIGTGNLTHNLREAFRSQHAETPEWVSAFAEWVAKKIADGDIESLLAWETEAPHAKKNHPTPEHFLPLFIALGAAGEIPHAKRMNPDTAMGVLAMDAYVFGDARA